jgi:hypothetical protein
VAAAPSVAELLDGHVSLDVECFDRLYLNAYVPALQTGGGTVRFLRDHRGHPIPSPALFGHLGDRFRAAVAAFAAARSIPLIRFRPGERKIAAMTPLLEQAETPGVVAIGTAQETQWVTMGALVGRGPSGAPYYGFRRAERRVSVFYFYIADADWGPCFIKLCAYFPYPGKVWCNGHEFAKRQLERRGIAYTALANGFASCEDPGALAEICAALGPADVQALVDRWMAVLPLPLTAEDRAAGYDWELSMRQVEVSRTLALDRPARARAFFERLVEQNAGLGRHDELELIFHRRVQRNTPGLFSTRIVHQGVEPRISIRYKSSRVKQYLKEGRAIRVETVINNPTDLGVKRRIAHLPELGTLGRAVNRRILEVQRVVAAPGPSTTLFERVALPDRRAGQRTVALRYGDPARHGAHGGPLPSRAPGGGDSQPHPAPARGHPSGRRLLRRPDELRPLAAQDQRAPTPAARHPHLGAHPRRRHRRRPLHEDLPTGHRPTVRRSLRHRATGPRTRSARRPAPHRRDSRPLRGGRADSRLKKSSTSSRP